MTNFKNGIVRGGIQLLIFAILALPAMAQIDIGSISGVVTDQQGAFVQGAQITVIETSTHATRTTTSNSDGGYTVLSLPAGTYDVTVSSQGFRTIINRSISLFSGENKKVDAKLAVGSITDVVSVTGGPPLLETREGGYSVGEEAKTLEALPVEVAGGKRDPITYLSALPGYQGGAGFQNNINGSVAGYNEVYVDGTPLTVNSAIHGDTRNDFSTEAVQEIKVVVTPMADLGNIGGAGISYITKSGTNNLHGAVYDYIRNTAFDARCDQFCPGKKPVDHQGEYGFSLGGPVYIPHVYDGRNKTFWWFNWGHYYDNFTVGASFYGVPTTAMKGGDFSGFLGPQIGTDAAGNPVFRGEIYDPSTTTTVGGQIVRTPFSGGGNINQIPTAAFSSVASKYQTFLPNPTVGGLPNGANYSVAGGAGKSPDAYYHIGIDQNIGSKDRISVSYWKDDQNVQPVLQLPLILEVASGNGPIGHFIHTNWTHLFTGNLVHSASFGFDRDSAPITSPPAAATGAQAIGQANPLGPCTPHFSIAGGYISSNRPDALCSQAEGDNNFEINDNWSLAKGRHLIKWGFNLIRWNSNFPKISNLAAGFLPAETSIPNSPTCPTCAANTGNAYASFLIGAVDSAQTQGRVSTSPRALIYGFYGQDEFKLTHKLTLTYALRYDYQPFPVERHDAFSQFEPTLPNPGCNNCPGAVAFLGFGPGTLHTRSAVPNVHFATNFGPKLGFAYQIQQNTVIRGAATLAYGPTNQSMAGFAVAFQQGYFPSFTAGSPDGISPAFPLDSGFPIPPGTSLFNNFDPAVANGSGTAYFGKTADRAPRILNTNFGIEHQFPAQIVVGVHYIGSYSHGILTGAGQELNQLNYAKYASYGQTCLTSDIATQVSCPVVVPLPYASFTGTVEQALRPFPQYQDVQNESAPTNTSTYSAGQITAQKNFQNGISFLVGYTLSRQFTNFGSGNPAFLAAPGFFSSPAQDAYNLRAEKAPAATDLPQVLLFNYTYQLPLGRGKRLNVDNRILNAVVGGWSVAGIHHYQSGAPLSVSSETVLFSQPQTALSSNFVRPNLVSGQSIRTNVSCSSFNPAGGNAAVASTYLNAAAFVLPGPLQFGNAPRAFGNARGCPSYNENFTLFKNFAISEKANLKFGVDAFNIFNRHQWAAPNTDVQSPTFGKIFGLANSPRSLQFNARFSF